MFFFLCCIFSALGAKEIVAKVFCGCCATPPVSERGVEFSPRVHPRSARASPAVKHGVSPPGTVGAGWEVSLFSPSPLSTGSPFGHHPRLRIVCPHRGQWVNSCEVRCTSPHTAWKVCTLSVDIHLLCHHFSGEAEQGNSSPPAEAHHA